MKGNNIRSSIINLEDEINILKEKILNQNGSIAINKSWFVVLDSLIKELIETREIADFAHQSKLTNIDWKVVNQVANSYE